MGGPRRSPAGGSHSSSRSRSITGSSHGELLANRRKDEEYARQQGWASIDEHRRQTARAEGYAELAKREQRYHRDVVGR
jgi:hypothetical protein